ncbi:MAG: ATPase, partial [Candidatus Cloacimonadota bacterium]
MSIKKLIVSNFKSFNEMEIELNNFNVLIGANASGKSNFVHIFEFLRDIVNFGLINAISMQGGIEYLKNMNIKHSKNLIIKLISDASYDGFFAKGEKIGIRVYETEYEFSL